MQGWRKYQEDRLLVDTKQQLYAVLDGHGGKDVSHRGVQLLPKLWQKAHGLKSVSARMRSVFAALDDALRDEHVGSTINLVTLTPYMILCGNAGDSRAVLCRGGVAVPLSVDHKPSDPKEMQRILQHGGWVEDDRVNGDLALSRGLGDKYLPEGVFTAEPDLTAVPRHPTDEFIVIASDGVWDCQSSQEVVTYIRDKLSKTRKTARLFLQEYLQSLLGPDADSLGSDNMSLVLILLHGNHKSEASWRETLKG